MPHRSNGVCCRRPVPRAHQTRPVRATTSSTPSTSAPSHTAVNPANLRLRPRLTQIGPPLRRAGSHVDRSFASPACSLEASHTAASWPERGGRRPRSISSSREQREEQRQMAQRHEIQRHVLPIPDRPCAGLVTYDAKDPDTSFPPIEPLRPPEGAPNVLIVLHRRRAASARRAPSAARARRRPPSGSRRTASSTTASTRPRSARRRARRCSRAATTTRSAWAASRRSPPRRRATTRSGPNTCAPLAETLKLNGYSTAQFGKCHEVPVWETSPMGPFDAWPTAVGGFEHFYGFIGGETNQYAPAHLPRHGAGRARQDAGGGLPLHRGHDRPGDRLDPPAEGADARQAVLRLLRAGRDARARTTCPPSGRTSTRGTFDDGWDALRERDVRAAEGARRRSRPTRS